MPASVRNCTESYGVRGTPDAPSAQIDEPLLNGGGYTTETLMRTMTGSPVLPAHVTDDEEATIRTAEALGQAGDVGEATRLLEAAIAAAAVRSVELPGRLTGQLASYYRMQGRGADEVRLLEYFHAPRKSERMRNRFLARLAAKTDCVEPEGMDRRDGTG